MWKIVRLASTPSTGAVPFQNSTKPIDTLMPSNTLGGAAGGPGRAQLTVRTPCCSFENSIWRNASPEVASAGFPMRSFNGGNAPGARTNDSRRSTSYVPLPVTQGEGSRPSQGDRGVILSDGRCFAACRNGALHKVDAHNVPANSRFFLFV